VQGSEALAEKYRQQSLWKRLAWVARSALIPSSVTSSSVPRRVAKRARLSPDPATGRQRPQCLGGVVRPALVIFRANWTGLIPSTGKARSTPASNGWISG
jgi:hypothetical protein